MRALLGLFVVRRVLRLAMLRMSPSCCASGVMFPLSPGAWRPASIEAQASKGRAWQGMCGSQLDAAESEASYFELSDPQCGALLAHPGLHLILNAKALSSELHTFR